MDLRTATFVKVDKGRLGKLQEGGDGELCEVLVRKGSAHELLVNDGVLEWHGKRYQVAGYLLTEEDAVYDFTVSLVFPLSESSGYGGNYYICASPDALARIEHHLSSAGYTVFWSEDAQGVKLSEIVESLLSNSVMSATFALSFFGVFTAFRARRTQREALMQIYRTCGANRLQMFFAYIKGPQLAILGGVAFASIAYSVAKICREPLGGWKLAFVMAVAYILTNAALAMSCISLEKPY